MLTPKMVCSKITGFAPLAVFFDATDTLDTATTQPIKNCHFQWTFDDPNSGVWINGALPGRSKNKHQGFVAAHTFENPGTYTITLKVTSANKVTTGTISQVITVTDFNTVYPDSTYYLANGATPVPGVNGVPGSTNVNKCVGGITTLDQVATYLASNRRVLLKRGDTFTTVAGISFRFSNLVLSSYGSGSSPRIVKDSSGVASYGTIINYSAGSSGLADNFILTDIDIEGDYLGMGVFGLNAIDSTYNISNILIKNVNTSKVGLAFHMNDGSSITPSNIFIDTLSCTDVQASSGSNCIWGQARNFAHQGSFYDRDHRTEHGERHMFLSKAVIANNTYANPGPQKGLLSLRPPNFIAGSGDIPPGTYTEYIQVSGNHFRPIGTNGPSGLTSGNVNMDGRFRYIIFEKNLYTDINTSANMIGLMGTNCVARNNIVDCNGVNASEGCGVVLLSEDEGISEYYVDSGWDRTPVVPTSCDILCNTIYTNNVLSGNPIGVAGIGGPKVLDPPNDAITINKAINTTAINNLVIAPNANSDDRVTTVSVSAGATGTVGDIGTHGNSNDTQSRTNPCEGSPISGNHYLMKPLVSSYAYQSGVNNAVIHDDFFDRRRVTTTPNIGAIENTKPYYKYGVTVENSV